MRSDSKTPCSAESSPVMNNYRCDGILKRIAATLSCGAILKQVATKQRPTGRLTFSGITAYSFILLHPRPLGFGQPAGVLNPNPPGDGQFGCRVSQLMLSVQRCLILY